jgi:hypothetical protein
LKSLTAGSEIDAWCTKCRMDLMHRIVAMVQSAPKRVICLTCNSEHNYRAPKTETTASGVHIRARSSGNGPKPTAAAQRVTQKARAEKERAESWASKTLGKAVDAFTRYAMDKSFREGELVLHSKFGEGYVEKVLEGAKISIMFRDGAKTLAHRAS